MNTDMQHKVIKIARSWLGTPYHHQASLKGIGTDCLGLIRGIWRETLGCEPESIPPYSADWSETTGDEVLWCMAKRHLCAKPLEQADLADIILLRMYRGAIAKHMGVVSALHPHPCFIHAYQGHGVIESPLSQAWHKRIVARFALPCIAD